MAAPKPERVVESLDELARMHEPSREQRAKGEKPKLVGLRVDLEEGYRWLYGQAHAPIRRQHERVRGGTGPDAGGTTASVGLSGQGDRQLSASTQDYVRSKLESAGKLIEDAAAAARGAATEMSRAFKKIDQDTGHTPSEFFDSIPKQEEPEELHRKHAAQRRREARGEVYAEDAVPTPDIEYETHRFAGRGLMCLRCGETPEHPAHDIDPHKFAGSSQMCRECGRKPDHEIHEEAKSA